MSGSTDHDEGAGRYEIRVRGHLEPRWVAWFDDSTLTTELDGTTLVVGHLADQSALHGLLRKVRDLGLPLVSVTVAEPDQRDVPPRAPHPVPHLSARRTT